MIMGIEVALTLMGFYMLLSGKSVGKDKVKDRRFRLVGGFLLTLFPVAIVIGIIVALIYGIAHPNLSPDVITQNLRWPLMGVEVGMTLLYALIAIGWAGSVEKQARARLGAQPQPTPPTPQAPQVQPPASAPQAPPTRRPPALAGDHPMIPKDKPFGS